MHKLELIIIAVATMLAASCNKEAVGEGYQDQFTYTSPLEQKYAADGNYAVTHESHDATEPRVGQHQVWYPSNLTGSNRRWPAVVLANGTGVNASRYEVIFRHLASWGFIVVGNEDASSWDGLTTILSLQHLLDLNRDATSPLYGKVDTTAIGLAGHSQGGVAVYNAATEYDLSHLFRCICPQSCSSPDLSEGLGWSFFPSKVSAPALLMAGTGNVDANTICPLSSLQQNYDSISGQPVIMGRIKGVDHGDVLPRGEAYTVAWMLYWLCGDTEAARCFVGNDAEMLTNSQWQDVQQKNL